MIMEIKIRNNMGYIYLFRRIKDNSPCYVGKHNGCNIDYFTSSSILKKKLKKNGKIWFDGYYKREIICDNINKLEDLNRLEIKYIKYFNTFIGINERGYNITIGGDGGDNFTNNPNKEKSRKNYIEAAKKRHREGKSKSFVQILNENRHLREKQKESVKKLWSEKREYMISLIKDNHKSGSNLSEILKKVFSTDEQKSKRRINAINNWKNEEYRSKRGNRSLIEYEEFLNKKNKISELSKEDREKLYKANLSNGVKKYYDSLTAEDKEILKIKKSKPHDKYEIFVYLENNELFKKFSTINKCRKYFKAGYSSVKLKFLDKNVLFRGKYYLTTHEIK